MLIICKPYMLLLPFTTARSSVTRVWKKSSNCWVSYLRWLWQKLKLFACWLRMLHDFNNIVLEKFCWYFIKQHRDALWPLFICMSKSQFRFYSASLLPSVVCKLSSMTANIMDLTFSFSLVFVHTFCFERNVWQNFMVAVPINFAFCADGLSGRFCTIFWDDILLFCRICTY